MSDSVGKISLDLELQSDLSKQISETASKIGEQLKASLQNLSSLDFKKMAESIGNGISKSLDASMKDIQNKLEETINSAIKGAMATSKKIKVPINFDTPSNSPVPSQSSASSAASPRAPPIPKLNVGANLDVVKAQIDNLTRSLDITNARIEQQIEKLASLRASYNSTFNAEKKDKIYEQILKTEAAINKLKATSDTTGFKLSDLDKQLETLGSASKKSTTGVDNVGKSLHKSHNSLKMFFGTMIQWGIIFPMISGAIRNMGKSIGESFMANTQFASSLNEIRVNLSTAFMPIYQAILPAINTLMSWLSKATAYFAAFISALFGKTYDQSKAAAKQLNNAKNAMKGYGNTAKKAGDKAKGALAGFDEINLLNLNKESANTGGGTGGAGKVEGPNFNIPSPKIDMSGINKAVGKLKEMFAENFKDLTRSFADFKKAFEDFYWPLFIKPTLKFGLQVAIEGAKSLLDAFTGDFEFLSGVADIVTGALAGNWDKVKKGIGKAGEGLIKVWRWVQRLQNPTLLIGDAFKSIGQNMIDGLFKGAGKKLAKVGSWLKKNIANPLVNGVKKLLGIHSPSRVFAEIGENIVEGLKEGITGLWSNFISGVQDKFNSIVDKFESIKSKLTWENVKSVFEAFGKWVKDTFNLSGALESVRSKFDTVKGYFTLDNLKDKFNSTMNWLRDTFGFSGALDNVKSKFDTVKGYFTLDNLKEKFNSTMTWLRDTFGFSGALDNVKTKFNTVKGYFTLDNLKEKFNSTMTWLRDTFGFSSALDNVKTKFNTVKSYFTLDNLKNKFNNTMTWLRDTFGFSGALAKVKDKFNTIKGQFSLDSLKSKFNSVKDWVTGTFKPNWEKAWTGVKSGFVKIVDTFGSVMKSPLNAILGAINSMIRKLRSLKISIPKITIPFVGTFGGGTAGFPWIDTIPLLAKGGIIEQPTLAMVGERGKEAVMPLEHNTGWITELAGQIAGMLNSGDQQGQANSDRAVEIVIEFGGYQFAKFIIDSINKLQLQSGKTLLKI